MTAMCSGFRTPASLSIATTVPGRGSRYRNTGMKFLKQNRYHLDKEAWQHLAQGLNNVSIFSNVSKYSPHIMLS